MTAEWKTIDSAPKDGRKYGCHVELEEDMEPDGCVIDYGAHSDCTYARTPSGRDRKSKWTCPYWRVVRPPNQEGKEK